MVSRNGLKNFSVLVVNFLVGFESGAQKLPQNLIQKQLTPNPFITTADLIKKHDLIRLWTLNDPKSGANPRLLIRDSVNGDFMDDQVTAADYANSSGMAPAFKKRSPLVSRFPISAHTGIEDFFAIRPLTCHVAGGETFAEFKSSYFTSDETDIAGHLVQINSNAQKTAIPLHSAALVAELEKVENQELVKNTTSLIKTIKYPGTNQERIIPSDYTIGGWFKPSWSNGTNQMTLLTKSFSNPSIGGKVENEWWIFATGNMIYFHPLYDTSVPAVEMYLDPVDARRFRMDNFIYYREGDSYDDAVRRNNPSLFSSPAKMPIVQPPKLKAFKVKKPIPPPDIVHPPLDPKPPVVVPFPPLPQPPIGLPPGGAHKAHIFDFDLKQFWWSTSLGICYECERKNEHRDVWHYIAISARLNDPLGPYIDFYVILDPQESIFGQRPTWEANFRHKRIDLPRAQVSRPHVNPILHSSRVSQNCDQNSKRCVRSQLKIGSDSPNDQYKGFMRGLYMSKSALSENAVIEMARQFRPIDACRLTYEKK